MKYLFELNALFYLTQKLSFKELPLFKVFKIIVYHCLPFFNHIQILMSKLFFYIFLLTFFTSCNDNQKKNNGLEEVRLDGKTSNADIVRMPITADTPLDTNNIAKITLEETDFNFGSVNEGDVVKHTFKLKNVGNQPLLITDIRTTCGCTVPTWNKSPIVANANDQVEVKFDTKGKANEQIKKITIIANTFPAETELILRGMVQVSK